MGDIPVRCILPYPIPRAISEIQLGIKKEERSKGFGIQVSITRARGFKVKTSVGLWLGLEKGLCFGVKLKVRYRDGDKCNF